MNAISDIFVPISNLLFVCDMMILPINGYIEIDRQRAIEKRFYMLKFELLLSFCFEVTYCCVIVESCTLFLTSYELT